MWVDVSQIGDIHLKIEWDLTNGPLSKLLELLDTQQVLLEISWMLLSCQQRDMVHSHPFVTLGHSMKQHIKSNAEWNQTNEYTANMWLMVFYIS